MAKATTADTTKKEAAPTPSSTETANATTAGWPVSGAGVTRAASRLTYNGSYWIAYGIVYATVFIAKSIPQDNPIVEGFIAGGKAAIEALNNTQSTAGVAALSAA